MKYDFDTPVERFGTDATKWQVKQGELPMWVADMDFKTAPPIIEALQNRASFGVFGYSEVPEEWYSAYIDRWKRHDLSMERDSLSFCTGVVPAISSVVRKLTSPDDNVLVQTPVYNIFFNSILNNGRKVLESPLVYDGESYSIDFADLEEKMSYPNTTLMLLCNPHNPIGKIWPKETLERIGNLAKKYDVTVLSDEIHCDITAPGTEYVPFASASETCREVSVTCISPTKAFNLAGVQTSAIYVPDAAKFNAVRRAINTDEVAEPNSFATIAAITAFTQCEQWLDELREYVFENRRIAENFIEKELPQLKAVKANATYLMWIDIKKLNVSDKEFAKFLREKTGLFITAGSAYGACGKGFFRMNVACPRSLLLDGLSRLKKGVEMLFSR